MNDFRIPLGSWVKVGVDWIIENLAGVFDFFRAFILALYDSFDFIFASPPFYVMIVVFAVLAYFASGWKFALGSILGFVVILSLDQWTNAMNTLSLVVVSSLIAVILSIPLGILAARSNRFSQLIRPVLDFMQTMPAFVYLVPAIMLFRVGVVPGIVAAIVFAMAPGVRLTELGIRNVDSEVVEAGLAFGAPPGRILRQIQLPLAMPNIMAGVNQVIMLSLSMVVIAAMVGAGGLGEPVVASLARIDVALGAEAGLSVVILAIYLDRLSSGFATKAPVEQ